MEKMGFFFVFLGWWMKGRPVPLFAWAMGSCMQFQRVVLKNIRGEGSQGDMHNSSPNLVARSTSLMVERVYIDPLLKEIIWVAPTKDYLQNVMGKLDQIHNVFILKVSNTKGR
jgi:hypothetical protein